jgi:glyoxylase-like metal-dependent hydrolase (beta-lactamase superfamily II)
MKRPLILILGAISVGIVAIGARAAIGFPATHHGAERSVLGRPSRGQELEAWVERPGPLRVETVVGCDWVVPRSGVINLDHPKAKAAKLSDGDEPIVVVFHVLRHPTHGVFLIDTGVERAMRDTPEQSLATGLVAKVMHLEKMRFKTVTSEWLERANVVPSGVFLTHLHLDHVTGMRDIPSTVPVYVGSREASEHSFMHWFTVSITDEALAGKPPLREWTFERDPDQIFQGIVDVFGDRSLFALQTPGHTAGSTAYLARTERGPVLITGDASHTIWGWEHGVEPGSYSEDSATGVETLERLKRFVARHPTVDVRLGHHLTAR